MIPNPPLSYSFHTRSCSIKMSSHHRFNWDFVIQWHIPICSSDLTGYIHRILLSLSFSFWYDATETWKIQNRLSRDLTTIAPKSPTMHYLPSHFVLIVARYLSLSSLPILCISSFLIIYDADIKWRFQRWLKTYVNLYQASIPRNH